MNTEPIFDFDDNSDLSNWTIENDNVMGGVSDGTFFLGPDGNGVFEGRISLENNGGFASVRYRPGKLPVGDYSKVIIRLKGDGKRYQFRIKSDLDDYRSYITYFETSGEWQEVEISLESLYPRYRGRNLDQPNFSGDHLEELGFLFGNGKEEDFRLEINSIAFK